VCACVRACVSVFSFVHVGERAGGGNVWMAVLSIAYIVLFLRLHFGDSVKL